MTMTADERRARYRERHGGTCVDCGSRTSLTKKGQPSLRCVPCHRAYVAAPEHGLSRYRSGCRCTECRAANAEYHRDYYRRKMAHPWPVPDHGTRARYGRGCTCELCVDANRAYKRAYYQRQRAAHEASS